MNDKKAKLHALHQKHIDAGKKITAKMLLDLPVSESKKAGSPTSYTAPRNDVEKKLTDAWAVVLGFGKDKHRIGIDTGFTFLGGDSLKATILAANLHKEFNVKLSLGDIFNCSNIRQMARYIQEAVKERYIFIEPAEERTYYPLSSAQKRVYILQALEKGSIGYNVPVVAWLEGQLNKQKLENAFNELSKRHESLRTSFHMLNNEPVQKIHDDVEFEIECYDLATEVTEDTEKRRIERIHQFIRAFDLSKAPLFRAGLIETGNLTHILMLDIHHIIADGTSFGIMFNELMVLYAEEGESLPRPRLQYKDYSQWQNSEIYQEGIQKQEEYWLSFFDDEIPLLSLPCDYPRPALQSFEGRRIPFEIGAGQTGAIKKLAQNNEATLYMVLLSLYNLLLSKVGGQEDIIVGTAMAGRNDAELQGIVGMFVNTLAMRNLPAGEKSFRQFLREVKKNSMEAFENRDYPFEQLVDRLEVAKDASRNPLFDTMFTLFTLDLQRFQNSIDGIPEVEIPGLSLKPYNYDPGISMFDLSLMAAEVETERGSELRFTFEYGTKLFKQDTIERFIGYFNQMLVYVLEEPEIKITDIEIISPEEKQRVLIDFNETTEDFPNKKTIHGLFEEQAERSSDGTAVVCAEQLQITYKELNKKSNQLARRLREKGVGPGDIVVLMVERSVEMMAAILGILKAGAAYLPIDPDCPRERLEFMLKDSNAKVLLKKSEIRISKFETNPNDQNSNDRNELTPCIVLNFEHLNFEFVWSLRDFEFRASNFNPLTISYIIYTSGSTGRPKGVMVPHSSIVCRLYGVQRKFGLNERDVVVHQTPYTFDVSVCELFRWIPGGGKGLFLPPGGEKDPAVIVRAIAYHRATTIDFIPSMLELFLDYLEKRQSFHLVSSLRWVLVGVESIAKKLVKKFNDTLHIRFGTRLINAYGPTEAVVDVTHFDCAGLDDKEIVPIGKPIANVRVYILDRYFRPQPIGIAGELCISGQTLATGYMNSPELTREKFQITNLGLQNSSERTTSNEKFLRGSRGQFLQKEPPGRRRLYKTGDLARWLPDGNIEFIGRVDFQVKIRGHRVELGEIENQLSNHEAIKEVVAAVNEREGDKYLCAYFVGNPGKAPKKAELKEYLMDKLPDYMIPVYFVSLDKIPRTSHGKVDRIALPQPGSAVGEKTIAPGNEIEKKLAAIWQEILFGKDTLPANIGIDDDFFRLGGHSLKAAIMVSQIHREFQVRLPLAEIFRTGTIRGLSRFIKEAGKEKFLAVALVEKRDYYPLSSAQKRLYIVQGVEGAGTAYNIPRFVTLKGAVDVSRMKNVFKQLIQRHESLRTSFGIVDGEPVQRIQDDVEFEIDYLAAKAFTMRYKAKDREDTVRNFISPFDLSKAPLLRAGIIETGNQEHFLMLDMHHIISDGISLSILISELTALYAGKQLPGLRVQYKDYAWWENSREFRAVVQQQETWWLKQFEFEREIPLLNLPPDYPRPVVQRFDGDAVGFEISPAETRLRKQLAQMENVTIYMLLLAVLNVFLSRLSGQEDIVVGTPTAGRNHQDLQPVMGMFVNTLALRNVPCGGKIFTAFLQEVKEQALQAFENQDYPFERLVEKVTVSRDAGRNPLFDVMFVLQNIDDMAPETDIPGLRMEPASFENPTAKFDLTLEAVETSNRVFCSLEYNTGLFKKETAVRFVRYFENILSSVVVNPEQRIADIELLPDEEKQQLLLEFNDTNAGYPKEKTLHQLFEEQAERTPNHTAATGVEQRQITYKELNRKAGELAYMLKKKGVTPDTIVALMMDRSVEMIIGMLAILKAGGAYLPISPNYPQERINYMLADSNAKMLLSEVSVLLCTVSEEFPTYPTHSTQLCYLLYTSGSTGQPKGVAVEHRSVVNTVRWFGRRYGLQPGMRVAMMSEYTFDASVNQVFATLLHGAALYIIPLELMANIPKLRQFIDENRINLVNFVPHLLDQLLGQDEKIGSLQWVISGGEALDEKIKNNICAKGYQLHNQYGPTETTIDALAAFCPGNEPVYLGRPIANTRCYIVDKYGNPVPIGVTGELCIAGAGAARGYLNEPELTAEKFCLRRPGGSFYKNRPLDPRKNFLLMDRSYRSYRSYSLNFSKKIYKTGDLARWLPDGRIEFRGRMDHQVKINGYRIELGEVEAALKKTDGIKEVVVTAAEEAGERFLCAYVVPAAGQAETSEKAFKQWEPVLRAQLSGRLPQYMVPRRFVTMETLPLTSTGKVDRGALPGPRQEGVVEAEDSTPASEVEKELARICCAVLERETMGTRDDFFATGGNSLKLIKLAAEIHRRFNFRVPLSYLFKNPTIEAVAHAIFNYRSVTEEEVVVFNESKAKKIFCFPPAVGFGIVYADFSLQLQDFSIYAFNYIDLDDAVLIRRYRDIIMENQPGGSAVLLGYSAGGKVAVKTAAALEKAGYVPADIILVDCYQTPREPGDRELAALDGQFDREIENSIARMGIEYMRDEIFQKIENYHAFHKRLIGLEPVNAGIHLITAADRTGKKEITPGMHWDNLTGGDYIIHTGYGTHREMFDPGYIEKNAAIVKKILV